MGANGDHGPAGPIAGNDRIVRVLDALVTQSRTGGWGVRELAGMITESRSTVNRVLQGLVQRRLASVEGNGAYVVGPRLRVLADALHERHPVLREAPAIISELAGQCEATTAVVMHGPGPTTAFVCVLHEHAGPVRYGIRPGMILPLHAGSAGRAVLSALGLEALDGVALDQFTQDTVVDRQQLAEELDRAARDGFVTSVGQHIPLAAGVAAPFVTASGEVAAVSATRPRYSTTDEDLARLGPLVRDAAARLSALPPSVPDRGPIGTRTTDGTALGRFERLLDILVAQPAGITAGRDLTARIGARPATTTKLRTTAETTGITRTTADGRIAAGPLLLRWAAVLGTRAPLADLVADDLAELAAETGETSGLTVFDSATATAVLQATVPGPDPVRYELTTGAPVPLHAGAAGKVILAHCPPEVVEKQSLEALTPRTPTTRDQLERDLRLIRERGWAQADGERIPDAFGLAAPFFAGDEVAGSVNLTIPRFRKDDLDLPRLTSLLRRTAGRITELLTV